MTENERNARKAIRVSVQWGVCWGIVLFLGLMIIVNHLFNHYDTNDVNEACAYHNGVQQVQDGSWFVQNFIAAQIVCRDGVVIGIGH